MAGLVKERIEELRLKEGNDGCADCGAKDPEWASYNIGILLCVDCAGIHRSLGTNISRIKSLQLGNWTEEELQMLETGNLESRQRYERLIPTCYKRPTFKDPMVLREQWIRAKYEREEFTDHDRQNYLQGYREGNLMKRGRDDKRFLSRKFVLNETEGTLKYFTKDDPKANAKQELRLDSLNVTLAPAKIGHTASMQIMSTESDGHTRNIFVYSEDSKDLIDWYMSIRSAKLNRLRVAYPFATDEELSQMISRDFLKEGWLKKTGPRPNDAYRRRWVSLDHRKLMYYDEPLAAFPKGEIFLGNKAKGFTVRDGVPPGQKDPGHSFTLKTPERNFHFAASNEDEKEEWLEVLSEVIEKPLTPQDSSNVAQGHRKRRSLPFR